jgi:hypothetical protein
MLSEGFHEKQDTVDDDKEFVPYLVVERKGPMIYC